MNKGIEWDALRAAWIQYNQLESEYSYSLEEGADTDITRQDVQMAWEVVDNMIVGY